MYVCMYVLCVSKEPSSQFETTLLSVEDVVSSLREAFVACKTVNNDVQVLFAIHTYTYISTCDMVMCVRDYCSRDVLTVCLYVCMYVCMYVCTFICMYVLAFFS